MSSIQSKIEKERRYYETLARPFLYQLVIFHGLSIRDFAEIFGIAKSHAEEVVNHRCMPKLELAFRIARYFSVTVDELFGWRVDDTGERSPLILEVDGKPVRITSNDNLLKVLRGE